MSRRRDLASVQARDTSVVEVASRSQESDIPAGCPGVSRGRAAQPEARPCPRCTGRCGTAPGKREGARRDPTRVQLNLDLDVVRESRRRCDPHGIVRGSLVCEDDEIGVGYGRRRGDIIVDVEGASRYGLPRLVAPKERGATCRASPKARCAEAPSSAKHRNIPAGRAGVFRGRSAEPELRARVCPPGGSPPVARRHGRRQACATRPPSHGTALHRARSFRQGQCRYPAVHCSRPADRSPRSSRTPRRGGR